MTSAIYFLDLRGKVLITRTYRADVPPSAVEKFIPLISEIEEASTSTGTPPVLTHNGVNYVWLQHQNIYILSVSRVNENVFSTLVFLHELIRVFTMYFKELEEESVRDNFVIVYELLDEMMDFGYAQITDTKILKEYITQDSHKLEPRAAKLPDAWSNNTVSWRSDGIFYRKNEVFLDVIESVNVEINKSGSIVKSQLTGSINMKCYLSGMPELKLGLNDKLVLESTHKRGKAVELEDIRFHQCVRLSKFDSDRTISFIPPDGEFELMQYRLSSSFLGAALGAAGIGNSSIGLNSSIGNNLGAAGIGAAGISSSSMNQKNSQKPLIWVDCQVRTFSHSRLEFLVKVKAQFKRRSTANDVMICVPVPDDATAPKFWMSVGTANYRPEQQQIVWSIRRLAGEQEYLMKAQISVPSVRSFSSHSASAAAVTTNVGSNLSPGVGSNMESDFKDIKDTNLLSLDTDTPASTSSSLATSLATSLPASHQPPAALPSGSRLASKASNSLSSSLGNSLVAHDDESSFLKRPIQVKFEIPYFSCSGIQVRYLKITEPKLQYVALPWVRYICKNGDYNIRIA